MINFRLDQSLKMALTQLKIKEFTNIQQLAIPHILNKKDVFIKSETGTGKTYAYAIPILQNWLLDKSQKSLILSPTKDICLQVYKQIRLINEEIRIKRTGSLSQMAQIVDLIDEGNKQKMMEALIDKINWNQLDILVSTPTQFHNLVQNQKPKLNTLVIDEFDLLMNDNNLAEKTKLILATKPQQVILCGASEPKRVFGFTLDEYIQKHYPEMVICQTDGYLQIPKNISHDVIEINEHTNKLELLKEIIDLKNQEQCLIFASSIDDIFEYLKNEGYNCAIFNAKQSVENRIKVLRDFDQKEINILICTDLASRAFDFNVNHVIQYEFASNAISFLHRIGRTGRLGRQGKVTSLIEAKDKFLWEQIQKSQMDFKRLTSRKRSLRKLAKKYDSY